MNSRLFHFLVSESERLLLWFPVSMGTGIIWYFSLHQEPSSGVIGALISLAFLFLLGVTWCSKRAFKILGWSVIGLLVGFLASFYRTHTTNPGMLACPTGARVFEGTLVAIEQTPHIPPRIRLVLTSLEAHPPFRFPLPHKVRLLLKNADPPLNPGDRIRVRANLLPVPQGVSPLCTDLRRQAFFKGIGATGFALTQPEILKSHPASTWHLLLNRSRHHLTQLLLEGLPRPLGSIAAALMTGDTSALPSTVRQDFANAGMSHILAISGLHLSIVAGFIFLLVQRAGSLIPALALRYPLHKVAALLSIFMTFLYLILSGEGVPAKRSFVMTGFVMVAVILDRRAVSLRLVAIAATVIFLTTPEALLGASFQLSFAAVIALIACYEMGGEIRKAYPRLHPPSKLYTAFWYGMSAGVSSLIASFATTPFAMVFFHQATLQAILSNMCAIPLVTFLIMPLAVVVCLSTLIHLETVTLPLFGYSLRALLWIAETVSTWPGACLKIPVGAPWGLGVFVVGGLWLCLWKSPIRWAGVLALIAGLWGLLTPHVPHFWIDAESKVIGFFDQKTRTLRVSSLKRGVFAQTLWADAAGAREIQEMPTDLSSLTWPFNLRCCLTFTGEIPATPQPFHLILSLKPLTPEKRCKGEVVIDAGDLSRGGACALWIKGPNPQDITVSYTHENRRRPWTPVCRRAREEFEERKRSTEELTSSQES